MGSVRVGVDIGQKRDPTAIAVTERRGNLYEVRYVQRLPLGTKYPAVVARICEVVEHLLHRDPRLLLDATGVGMPVVDMVRAALEAKGLDEIRVMACFFTHGDRLTQESRELRVGKAYLVSTLQALLQSNRIKWKRTPETEYLAEELLDYEIHVDQDANDKYGAVRVGTHDDVVTAVGLTAIDDGLDRDVAFASSGSLVSRTIAEDLAWRAGQVRAQALAGASGATTPDDEDELDPEREAASLEHQARLARMLQGLGDIRYR